MADRTDLSDVFLTPIKPPTKGSVSAEAIQSSLYYLHVKSPEDEAFKESLEQKRNSLEAERPCRTSSIHRKPLPHSLSASHSAPECLSALLKGCPHPQAPSALESQSAPAIIYTARAQQVRLRTAESGDAGVVQRRPVGPRPLRSRFHPSKEDVIKRKPVSSSDGSDQPRLRRCSALPAFSAVIDQNAGARDYQVGGKEEQIPTTRSNAMSGTDSAETGHDMTFTMTRSETMAAGPHGGDLADKPCHTLEGQNLNILLIRRDPASSGQWNIGNIFWDNSPTDTARDSFTIEISSPGYQKFARYADPGVLLPVEPEREDPSSMTRYNPVATSATCTVPSATSLSTGVFTRVVKVSSGSSPSQSRRLAVSDDVSLHPDPIPPANLQGSARNQHYCFTSPWHGQCTFSTGRNGRSLECRHTLPIATSMNSGSSVSIANLRFNLPWVALRSRDVNARASARGKKSSVAKVFHSKTTASVKTGMQISKDSNSDRDSYHIDSHSSGQSPRVITESDSETESDLVAQGQLDLRLRQEKAGGGWQGKNAKLGKLIIEDEGLKMCDLVVAGCMGVFLQYFMAKEKG